MRNAIQLILHSSARMCVTWASVQAKSQTIKTFRSDLRKDVKQSFRAVPFSRFSNKLLFCIGVGDCLLDMLPVSNVSQWSSAACFFCGVCVFLLELVAFSSWELERFIPAWFLRSWKIILNGSCRMNEDKSIRRACRANIALWHAWDAVFFDGPSLLGAIRINEVTQAQLLHAVFQVMSVLFWVLTQPFHVQRISIVKTCQGQFQGNRGHHLKCLWWKFQLMPCGSCACCLDFPGRPERIRPSGFGYA